MRVIFHIVCFVLLFCVMAGSGSAQTNAAAGQVQTSDEQNSADDLDEELTAGFPIAEFVEQKARRFAEKSFRKSDNQVPDFLLGLNGEEWNKVEFKPDKTLWRQEALPFEVAFIHPGFIYNRIVNINIVDSGESSRIPFSSESFNYGVKGLSEKVQQVRLSYAGFRVYYPLNTEHGKDEVVIFLGATYFKSAARNSQYGLSARGIALNTALPDGEEFPYFREFWLVKPEPKDTSLTIYALMDSQSMTGAYRFVITPGTSTVMEVTCKLFPRRSTPLPQKIGLAPLNSMFLFSETTNGSPTDYRPEVHNSDGLLYTPDGINWLWRPLENPARLTVSSFPMENPSGFGLMQRDNIFDHYQDIYARFDRRVSLWVEPAGDWDFGRIELIEIPAREEWHENIVAFWIPDTPDPTAETPKESLLRNGQPISFAYKLYWMASGVTPHNLGRVVSTRISRGPKPDTMTFIIDFESESLKSLPADTGLTSVVEGPQELPVSAKNLVKNPVTGGWRLSFQVSIPRRDGLIQSILTAREGFLQARFRAFLKKGENLPDILTEVWVYDISF